MHPSAMTNCQQFFDCYGPAIKQQTPIPRVIEIGSQNVNGSIRQCCPTAWEYIGVDFVAGNGVDQVLEDPYTLPFETSSVDVLLSSSCFEHSEMFWLLFLEMMRVLKPTGLFYLNVPANGPFHRYPVDCWRFYPDSGRALVTWAKRNGMNPELLESYTSAQSGSEWNDFVAVFLRDAASISKYPRRIIQTKTDYTNGLAAGHQGVFQYSLFPEDILKIEALQKIAEKKGPL